MAAYIKFLSACSVLENPKLNSSYLSHHEQVMRTWLWSLSHSWLFKERLLER